MADVYFVGQQLRLSCTFTVDGTATDPTTVTLKVTDPSGNLDTYTYALAQIAKSTTGVFYKDINFAEEGYWKYRWEGTGACAAVTEGSVRMTTEFS